MEGGDEEMEPGNTEEQEELPGLTQTAPPSQPQQQQQPQQVPPQQQPQGKKGNKKQPDNPCIACGKNVTTNSVQCTLCTLWCHKACTNLSAEAFKGLEVQAREVGVAYWACRACLSFTNKVNRQLQATSKRQDELENKVDNNIRTTDNNTQELEKLKQELTRMKSALEQEREERCDMLSEELRDREVRRNNLIIHGMAEPDAGITNSRERMEMDRRLCSDMFTAMGVRMRGEELRFCRRVGERGRDARPIAIGIRNEEEKRQLLDRARLLRGTRYDNISVVPDMTRMQRRAEDKLTTEAEARNRQLTEADLSMNMRWMVVGKRGEKRLLKGVERDQQHNNRRGQQLADYLPASGQYAEGASTGAIRRNTYQQRILDPIPATNSNYTPIQHRRVINSGQNQHQQQPGIPARGGLAARGQPAVSQPRGAPHMRPPCPAPHGPPPHIAPVDPYQQTEDTVTTVWDLVGMEWYPTTVSSGLMIADLAATPASTDMETIATGDLATATTATVMAQTASTATVTSGGYRYTTS
jgi:hypothetical protein